MNMHSIKKAFLTALFSVSIVGASAQDTWIPSEPGGFGNPFNEYIFSLHTFKGQIYAGTGNYTGEVYRSATGNPDSWSNTFADPQYEFIPAMTSTTEGGGYLFFSATDYFPDAYSVFRSFDGVTNTLYYSANGNISHIIPFKGTGTTDSIYIVEDNAAGALVHRASHDNNDPMNMFSTWSTVFDLSSIAPNTLITSSVVHNGKLYFGTDMGGTLYSSSNGTTFTLNAAVGTGFGNANNTAITSMCSFGGYLYVATSNGTDGAQIYRSNDDTTWFLVSSFPSFDMITDMEVADAQLWVALRPLFTGPGKVVRSSDGTTFVLSQDNGMGDYDNNGDAACFTTHASNIYYGTRNYYPAMITRGGMNWSTGGQIWRSCLDVAPTVNVGPDTLVCGNVNITFDGGAGMASYQWSTGDTTQLMSTSAAGEHIVFVVAPNGCAASDTVEIAHRPTPTVNLITPESTPVPFCLGDTVSFSLSAMSNVYNPMAPISKVTHDTIDNSLGDQLDSILVTGVPGSCACTSLLSVTIDSLDHEYTGDVYIGLYDPSGSYIILSNQVGSSSNLGYQGTEFRMDAFDFTSSSSPPFTGSFLPVSDFSNLMGNPNGYWSILTGDVFNADNGVLKGWTIRFQVEDTVMSFSWTPTTGIVSTNTLNTQVYPTANTAYTLTTTNSIGCQEFTTVETYIPTLDIDVVDDSLCYGNGTTINVADGNMYLWTPDTTITSITEGMITVSPLSTNTYFITDTVAGCAIYDSVTVYVDPALTLTANTATICFGDTTTLTMTPVGGTPPYIYYWNDGSSSYNTQSIDVSPTSGTSYTVNVTDAFSCMAYTSSMVAVMPSTDIFGHVSSASSSSITNGTVVLYKYQPIFIHFDTVQITNLDAAGNYYFSSVPSDDYIMKVFADSASYPLAVPTYYGNTFLWDSATVINHYCAVNGTLNVVLTEEEVVTGPGFLRGRIIEGVGFDRAEGDPVPGIDVKLGRNPGGSLVIQTETDESGYYYFTNVPYNVGAEFYTVYVDIPGLERDSSYTFVVDAVTDSYYYLDYLVDSSKVYIIPDAGAGVGESASVADQLQVYPNPSNGSATISYTLANNARVDLGIYNILGVKLMSLVSAEQQSGKHSITIDAADHKLSNGVYFITLICEGRTSIHRLVISK
jgi:subtilisin-like proprotein convertase family protein